jgi:uncharacterized protein (DUF2147 family)
VRGGTLSRIDHCLFVLLRIEDRMAAAKFLMLVSGFATAVVMGVAAPAQAGPAPSAAGRGAQLSNSAGSISPAGYWVTEDHAWTIHIATCRGGFCGTIVGLGASPRPDALRKDIQNPDATKRSATLCGLPVLGDFVPSSTVGAWEGGWIYNPENGEAYKSVMEFEGSGTLKVRGYVLVPLFGRTETLTRISAPARRCSNIPGVATGAPSNPTG